MASIFSEGNTESSCNAIGRNDIISAPETPRMSSGTVGHNEQENQKTRNEEYKKAEHIITWWEKYLASVIAVSIFGGSITFSVVLQDIVDPARLNPEDSKAITPTRYDRESVRRFLATSVVLFFGELALCSLLVTVISFNRTRCIDGFGSWSKGNEARQIRFLRVPVNIQWCLHICSLFINGLLVASFMYLSLTIVAYVEFVGWIGVGFTAAFGLVTIIIWVGTACITYQENCPRRPDQPQQP